MTTAPAPLWRRLAAAVYDALLLIALWMVALWLDVVMRDALGLDRNWPALRAYLFLLGLFFFGWFWTHGGQTLGMRAWRLRLLDAQGRVPGWPALALRYVVAGVALAAFGLGYWWAWLDPQRRTWHDLASGTRVLRLPR